MTAQTVLITGAASGIGRAAALLAAERGARVAALDIDRGGLAALSSASDWPAGSLVTYQVDVSDEGQMEGAFEAVIARLGVPTAVFANAGIEINAPAHLLAATAWERLVSINLTGVFLTCRFALAAMLDASVGGAIVCTSSPSAFVGFAGGGNAAYGASKGGVSALVRSLAIDYAPYGIRVNGVVPGATDTPMLFTADGPDRGDHDAQRRLLQEQARVQVPLGRLADPVEIARTVLWLLSGEASYVTGSHLVCDGGLMAKSANTF
jgi:NAD(P)-dependent dehydrogenase (short-subunit alcohol dehydrogenase family)